MLKILKRSGIYVKYCELKATNLLGKVELPDTFNDAAYCLKWLRSLDEAHMYAQPHLFEKFAAYSIRVNADYATLHGRSLIKPLAELWGLNFELEVMDVDLNSKLNAALFQSHSVSCIFNRFPLRTKFNKLPSRLYYNGQLEIQRLTVSIQGQQTFLFLNDFGNNLDKVCDIVDLSRSD